MNAQRLLTDEEHDRLDFIIWEVREELKRAMQKFGPMRSGHEGFAILMEEVDELWEAVRLNQGTEGRSYRMERESTQVAAMAILFRFDLSGHVG